MLCVVRNVLLVDFRCVIVVCCSLFVVAWLACFCCMFGVCCLSSVVWRCFVGCLLFFVVARCHKVVGCCLLFAVC